MRKLKSMFNLIEPKLAHSSKNDVQDGKRRGDVTSPKTISGIWPLVILLGLLLAVVLMHWLRTSN